VPAIYERTESVEGDDDLWSRLASGEWDHLADLPDGTALLGAPPRKAGSSMSGTATVIGPDAKEGEHGVRVDLPTGRASDRWFSTREAAALEYEQMVASYLDPNAGRSGVFRVQQIEANQTVQERLVRSRGRPAEPLLDSLLLTFLGVLATVIAAFGFGFAMFGWVWGILAAIGSGWALVRGLRDPVVRKRLIRFASSVLDPSSATQRRRRS
jgi:hypothetical protein